MEATFGEDVVRQVARHMNEDHAGDCVNICRVLGGVPGAREARMTGLDADGMDLAALVDGREVPVRIAWSGRLSERAQIRQEVVRMAVRAREALGTAPTGDH